MYKQEIHNPEKENESVAETQETADTQEAMAEETEETAKDETPQEDSEHAEDQEEKSPLEVAQEENEKLKDQLLRTIAEFENYKRRTLKEKTELILNGGEKAVIAILPIIDDLERALSDTHTDDVNAIKEGIDLIYKKFLKTLEELGVKKIETDGQDFDVDFHEAIAMVPGVEDDKKGKVIDCVQTGYSMNEKVIRHAKVAVGQ